jgi:hypothetical protein
MIGWVNTNLYTRTTEVLGILPIPTSIRTETGMAEYQPAADHKQKHHFLAEMQGTRKPVLPVHSPAERNLFRQLMNTSLEFNQPDGPPNWKQAIKLWNRQADMTDGISYKVCQQIFY